MINQERANNGLGALTINSALESSSIEYARFLMDNVHTYFDHGLDGLQPFQRAAKYGFVGRVAEEIAVSGSSANEVMQAWINDPPHLAGLLKTDDKYIGVGCYQGVHVYGNGSSGFIVVCVAEFGKTF